MNSVGNVQLWRQGVRLLYRGYENKCLALEVEPSHFLTQLEAPVDYRVLDLRNADVEPKDMRPLLEALRDDTVFTAIDLRGQEKLVSALAFALLVEADAPSKKKIVRDIYIGRVEATFAKQFQDVCETTGLWRVLDEPGAVARYQQSPKASPVSGDGIRTAMSKLRATQNNQKSVGSPSVTPESPSTIATFPSVRSTYGPEADAMDHKYRIRRANTDISRSGAQPERPPPKMDFMRSTSSSSLKSVDRSESSSRKERSESRPRLYGNAQSPSAQIRSAVRHPVSASSFQRQNAVNEQSSASSTVTPSDRKYSYKPRGRNHGNDLVHRVGSASVPHSRRGTNSSISPAPQFRDASSLSSVERRNADARSPGASTSLCSEVSREDSTAMESQSKFSSGYPTHTQARAELRCVSVMSEHMTEYSVCSSVHGDIDFPRTLRTSVNSSSHVAHPAAWRPAGSPSSSQYAHSQSPGRNSSASPGRASFSPSRSPKARSVRSIELVLPPQEPPCVCQPEPVSRSRSPAARVSSPAVSSFSPAGSPSLVVVRSRTPDSHSKSLVDSSKSPAARSKSPAARSKSPAARSKSPAARSKSPAARSKSPAARSKSPAARSKSPAARSKSPAAPSRSPAAHSRSPAVHIRDQPDHVAEQESDTTPPLPQERPTELGFATEHEPPTSPVHARTSGVLESFALSPARSVYATTFHGIDRRSAARNVRRTHLESRVSAIARGATEGNSPPRGTSNATPLAPGLPFAPPQVRRVSELLPPRTRGASVDAMPARRVSEGTLHPRDTAPAASVARRFSEGALQERSASVDAFSNRPFVARVPITFPTRSSLASSPTGRDSRAARPVRDFFTPTSPAYTLNYHPRPWAPPVESTPPIEFEVCSSTRDSRMVVTQGSSQATIFDAGDDDQYNESDVDMTSNPVCIPVKCFTNVSRYGVLDLVSVDLAHTEVLPAECRIASLNCVLASGCSLSRFSLGTAMQNLRILDLSNNSLTVFPVLDTCQILMILVLANNLLTAVAGQLGSLVELNLENNRLVTLRGLEHFPRLRRLNIAENELTTLTMLRLLANFPLLSYCAVKGNPLTRTSGFHVIASNIVPSTLTLDCARSKPNSVRAPFFSDASLREGLEDPGFKLESLWREACEKRDSRRSTVSARLSQKSVGSPTMASSPGAKTRASVTSRSSGEAEQRRSFPSMGGEAPQRNSQLIREEVEMRRTSIGGEVEMEMDTERNGRRTLDREEDSQRSSRWRDREEQRRTEAPRLRTSKHEQMSSLRERLADCVPNLHASMVEAAVLWNPDLTVLRRSLRAVE